MTMGPMACKVIGPIAWLVPALIVVQAAMVGETMFGGRSLIALHGSIGNLTFLLAAITLALAWSAKRSGLALLLTFTTVLLLFAQIGLGYLGHRTGLATASSVHVTLGVLVMGVSAAAAMRCTSERDGLPPSTSA
jgi:hypothetical protein